MRRAAAGALAVLIGIGTAATAAATPAPQRQVIVQGPTAAAAASAVEHAGGQVLRRLDLVDAVAARLPARAVLPGFTVTPDAALRP